MSYRVLIVNYYYPPIVNGGVQRTFNFKKYLSRMGFDVSFLTTNSFGSFDDDYTNNVLRFPDKGYDYTQSAANPKIGIFFFRAYRLLLVKSGLITDGKYFWKKEVLKNLDEVMSSGKYDVVIASYPTPANLEIGEWIHKKYNIPLVVDYRDGLMYEPFYEIQKSFIICKLRLLALEKRIAECASLHITVNREMNQYYAQKYPNVRSVVIPNGFDDEEVLDAKPLELPQGINILYTGSIGKSRRLYSEEELAQLFALLLGVSKEINFIFIGDYTEAEKKLFNQYDNVFVYEKTDRKTVIATQRTADALLLISGPDGATSGKLYEYMFSGKPILNIGGEKGISSIINGRSFGATVSPDDKEGMENFLEKIKNKNSDYQTGELTQYTRRYQSEVLANELRSIIARDAEMGQMNEH